jgi:hypothetical protein
MTTTIESSGNRERDAYLRGLAVDTAGGIPLTAGDRKAAVLQLRAYDPKLSIRQLAKFVGIDERQARRWLATPPSSSPV